MPSPGDRLTNSQDIKRLRALADAGVQRATAARQCGMDQATVRYWDMKERLGFVLKHAGPAAPLPPRASLPKIRHRNPKAME